MPDRGFLLRPQQNIQHRQQYHKYHPTAAKENIHQNCSRKGSITQNKNALTSRIAAACRATSQGRFMEIPPFSHILCARRPPGEGTFLPFAHIVEVDQIGSRKTICVCYIKRMGEEAYEVL